MVHHASTSPTAEDYANFTELQKQGWDRPSAITQRQRLTWASSLAEVVVTNPCDCGHCPSIGKRPVHRMEDESRDDTGGLGDFTSRIILNAAVDGYMLLLFIDDDGPSYLELALGDDEQVYNEFPPPERIVFRPLSSLHRHERTAPSAHRRAEVTLVKSVTSAPSHAAADRSTEV